MARKGVSLGYQVPNADSVAVEDVTFRVGDQTVNSEFAGTVFWDYETPILAEATVKIDLSSFVSSSGFVHQGEAYDERFGIHLWWRSTRTKQQGSGPVQTIKNGSNELSVDIPSVLVGGRLELQIRIFLLESKDPADGFVTAEEKGSRLWESNYFKIPLEGSGSRLTMSTRNFRKSGIDPPTAMWRVEVHKDLLVPVELGLSVFINTDNAASLQMLEKPNSPKSKVYADWLESEIRLAMLIEFLLNQDRKSVDEEEFEEGTLGQAMINLAERCFPRAHILDMPRDPAAILAATHRFGAGGNQDS